MFTGAEASCKFISVTIPDNITAIGKGAFFHALLKVFHCRMD